MFKKKEDYDKPIKGKVDSHDRLNRLVTGTKLVGDLNTASSLRIDGEIVGNIHCAGRFVLGKEGVVKGDIFAVEVELNGIVEGQIQAEALLTLHKTATLKGNAYTKRIVIEEGAQIGGMIKTEKFPKHKEPQLETKLSNTVATTEKLIVGTKEDAKK